jgi:2-polyprenyl-3-methyl-5-hydroxy-6-metoxy-1,4-benzoquinol methylase
MKKVKVGKRVVWEKQISKKDFILDIGCWSGEKMLELLPQTKNVFGMDIDESNFKIADIKVKSKLKVGDVTKKIPFSQKFDWVIFAEVLEHVSNDKAAIKNISNCLKKGGKLILTTPRAVKYFQVWDPAWVRWKFLGGGRHYHYTKKELFGMLEKNRLKVKEYYVQGNLKWVFCRWFTVIMNYVFRVKKNFFPKKEEKGFCDWIILAEKI